MVGEAGWRACGVDGVDGAGEGTAGWVLDCGGCLVEAGRRFGACVACA